MSKRQQPESASPKETPPSAVDGSSSRTPVGRGEQARQRILHAALEVLAESGLAGFNMESIARKAGAGKATLYRHWTSPSTLLVDAMDAQFRPFPGVSTGDVRADLITLLSAFASLLNDSPFPKLMAAFIDAAERDPVLASLHADLTHRRRQPMLKVLAEGVQRQDIVAEADLELVVDFLTGPFFYRRFIAHRAIPPELATAVVDQVLKSLRPGPAGKARPRSSNETATQA
jgi:AcrR family transcriptional regulator